MKPLYKLLAATMLATCAVASASAQDASADAPYKVAEGNKVDANTLKGWKTWRSLACERCHGAQQEGLVGPSLVESLKHLSKTDFQTTVMNGRIEKGMPNFGGSQQMQENWQNLYAYLKGRSDGKIQPGHVQPMDAQ